MTDVLQQLKQIREHIYECECDEGYLPCERCVLDRSIGEINRLRREILDLKETRNSRSKNTILKCEKCNHNLWHDKTDGQITAGTLYCPKCEKDGTGEKV
jgi:hypothetical protein